MKKINIIIASILFALFYSCDKDIEIIQIQEGVPSVVEANVDNATTITLIKDEADNVVYELDWTNVDYLGDNSSVLANYVIEISSTDNFAEPVTINPPEHLTYDFSAININTILIEQLGATIEEPFEAFFRIKSTFNEDVLYSNTISNTFIPYRLEELPAIFLPPNETIYIAGAAAGNPWPLTTTFTKVTETVYTLETALIGGATYEFVTDAAWNQAYRIPADVNAADVATAGTFVEDGNMAHDEFGNEVSRWEGQNFLSPPEDGIYTITLDFKSGTYTVEPGSKPAVHPPTTGEIYIAGPAVGNPWPLETTMTKESELLYTLEIQLIGGQEYEFVSDEAWNQAYKLPADVVPADVALAGTFVEDGNKAHDESGNEVSRWEGQNFISPPDNGLYLITLNFQNGTYTIVAQ